MSKVGEPINPPWNLFLIVVLFQARLSTEREVVLDNVDFTTTGQYRCEVSGDAPMFQTASTEGILYVVGEYLSFWNVCKVMCVLKASLILAIDFPFETKSNCKLRWSLSYMLWKININLFRCIYANLANWHAMSNNPSRIRNSFSYFV